MAYASILCETCEYKNDPKCYCAPNSVCGKYKEEKKTDENNINVNVVERNTH